MSPCMYEVASQRCQDLKTRRNSNPAMTIILANLDVDRYHWALTTGPKKENDKSEGLRVHAREKFDYATNTIAWKFEERAIPVYATEMLLARICVGKIEDDDKFVSIVRSIPIRDKEQGWNCVFWVAEALERLVADEGAMGTSVMDWQTVRDAAMSYVQEKKDAHRFDGRGDYDMRKAATFSLIEGKELIP